MSDLRIGTSKNVSTKKFNTLKETFNNLKNELGLDSHAEMLELLLTNFVQRKTPNATDTSIDKKSTILLMEAQSKTGLDRIEIINQGIQRQCSYLITRQDNDNQHAKTAKSYEKIHTFIEVYKLENEQKLVKYKETKEREHKPSPITQTRIRVGTGSRHSLVVEFMKDNAKLINEYNQQLKGILSEL